MTDLNCKRITLAPLVEHIVCWNIKSVLGGEVIKINQVRVGDGRVNSPKSHAYSLIEFQ